jgi:Ca2+-binding EF-hand superfamily protein
MYQTPIVFGTQIIMVPAYIFCIAMRIWCAADLIFNPLCGLKILRLYCVLSIYTWCRVFYSAFNFLNLPFSNTYTISIALAGAVCLPAVGEAVAMCSFAFILLYGVLLNFFGSPATVAKQCSEHPRDLFDTPQFQTMLGGGSSVCPFALSNKEQKREYFRRLFDIADADGNGEIDATEMATIGTLGNSAIWSELLEYHRTNGDVKINFETFCNICGTRSMIDSEMLNKYKSKLAVAALTQDATYDDKAKFFFSVVDQDNSGSISLNELAFLLMQYSLPFKDAARLVQKFDLNGDGSISYHEFKSGFKPLILFQIEEAKDRLAIMSEAEKRANYTQYRKTSIAYPIRRISTIFEEYRRASITKQSRQASHATTVVQFEDNPMHENDKLESSSMHENNKL